MDVWHTFPTVSYTFLKIAKGGVKGSTTSAQYTAQGIFKERNGRITQNQNLETVDSSATLHIRPDEAFLTVVGGNTVGHGVRIAKNGAEAQEYRVTGQVEGYDFANNRLDFYRLTLKPLAEAS